MSKVSPCRSRTITVIRRGRFQGTPLPGNKKPQGHVPRLFLWKRQQCTLPICTRAVACRAVELCPRPTPEPNRSVPTKLEGSSFSLGFFELVPFKGWEGNRPSCAGERGGLFKGKKKRKKPLVTQNLKIRNAKHSREKGSHHCICPAGTGAGPETF